MKKQFFLPAIALIFSLFAVSCNDKKDDSGADKKMDNSSATSKAARNKANVLKAYDAINSGKLDGFRAVCAKDIIDHEPGVNGKSTKGVDSVVAGLQMYLTAFPDMKAIPSYTVAEGNWVAVFNHWTGTWKGDLMGMKATGKSFDVNDADLFKMDEQGMVLEHWPTQEFSAIAAQVGAVAPK